MCDVLYECSKHMETAPLHESYKSVARLLDLLASDIKPLQFNSIYLHGIFCNGLKAALQKYRTEKEIYI